MDFNETMDALKKLASDMAQTASTAAKKAALVTKTNLEILSQTDKRKKAYLELGKLYYRDFIMENEPDDAEYLPLCDKITEATKAIDELKAVLEKGSAQPAEEEEQPAEDAGEAEEVPVPEFEVVEDPEEDPKPAEDPKPEE